MNQVQKLLIIGFVWPEPNSSITGGRMMQLISLFKADGFSITFASSAQNSDFIVDLYEYRWKENQLNLIIPVLMFYKRSKSNCSIVWSFYDERQFGWRVAENCPDALRLLDTEDLHCLRLARQKAFKENRLFKTCITNQCNRRQSWIFEPQIRWNHTVWKGEFDVLLGATAQRQKTTDCIKWDMDLQTIACYMIWLRQLLSLRSWVMRRCIVIRHFWKD